MTTTDKTARDALVVGNLGLAHHMARKFTGTGIELEDLVSIAYLGLIKAADTYDPDRGVRLPPLIVFDGSTPPTFTPFGVSPNCISFAKSYGVSPN